MHIEIFDELELIQDIIAVVITFILIQAFILFNDWLKKNEIVSTTVTRKMIHIWAAPIYTICWLLYSDQWFAPYVSLIVPGIFALQFILIGIGKMENEPFVQSMCRTGDPKELLKGTLYYAIFMMVGAILFWKNPVAIVMFFTLAFGDGLADVVGRSINRMKFEILAPKSVPGTLAMFLASLIASYIGLIIFEIDIDIFLTVTIIAVLVATIVEVVSPKETDNITIPLAIIVVFYIWSIIDGDIGEIFNILTP